MMRLGRTNIAKYRVCAFDSRTKRDGEAVEILGSYDPHASDETKFKVDADRVVYWLSKGAKPSEKVAVLLKKAHISLPKK